MSVFNVNISVTGDCTSTDSGAAMLLAVNNSNTTPPFVYNWYNPSLGTGSYKTGLSAGTYMVAVNDSSVENNVTYVNVTISSGCCAKITNAKNTTCGNINGMLTISADTITPFSNTFDLYSGGTLVDTFAGTGQVHTFTDLAPGLYHGVVTDSGGCTGKTQNCIIENSKPMSFGLFVIPVSACEPDSGRIFVTGQTGSFPFTYVWLDANGQIPDATGHTVSGLSEGIYSVKVISADNCMTSQSVHVGKADPLELIVISADPPDCFESNGKITVRATGGQAPYFYSGSNGTSEVTYSPDYTFTGLSSGSFTVNVTDVGLCLETLTTSLVGPNAFDIISITVTNPVCGTKDGGVTVVLNGAMPPYTMVLTGPDGTQTITTMLSTHIFTDLSVGEYHLTISNGSSDCVYETDLEIVTEPAFTISADTVWASCGEPNGSVTLEKSSGGTAPYIYELTGPNNQSAISSSDSHTFTDLSPGNYLALIKDVNGCYTHTNIEIGDHGGVDFILHRKNCGPGVDGELTVIITSGTAPYIIDWHPQVSDWIYATGLTSGNYVVTVTDSLGCTMTKEAKIECSSVINGTATYTICEKGPSLTHGNDFGLIEMLNHGFQNTTSGDTTCTFNSAEFILSVTVDGTITDESIYVSTSLFDVPDQEWFNNKLIGILTSMTGIGGVVIENNTITIISDCEEEMSDLSVNVVLTINYDVTCDEQ